MTQFNHTSQTSMPAVDSSRTEQRASTPERIMRQLTIRSFHVSELCTGTSFSLIKNPSAWSLTIPSDDGNYAEQLCLSDPLIQKIRILPISPAYRHIPIHSIMDIIPISVKAAGKIGEGITHTLTGVYIVLTGGDEEGTPVCAFGSSAGMLDEQISFNKAGTPGDQDFIILFDVTLRAKAGLSRHGPNAAHHACDLFCQEIRSLLKAKSGRECTESHCYQDVIRPDKKKVAIVKLVSGQGAMYDTHFLGNEPSSYEGSHSIIDITGAPILLSPNEYRDGAIRAMY